MYIRTEDTPNPQTLKFTPGQIVVPDDKTYHLHDKKEAAFSPLAFKLLETVGVESVFLGHDFISITKKNTIDWQIIKPEILSLITEHFLTGQPVLLENTTSSEASNDEQDHDDPIIKQIKAVIDEKVRPAVANDGGDIIFRKFDPASGAVYLELQGACSGCPSSTITLKNGVERLLSHYVPEVQYVEEFYG